MILGVPWGLAVPLLLAAGLGIAGLIWMVWEYEDAYARPPEDAEHEGG